ncbi:MAG: rhamnulokinase [Bacilli bacterium]|nr:rhamnulokinase [Bacilli bacterium]
MAANFLAIDFGASSGRHIVGYEENGELVLKEVYRFPNGMKPTEQGLVWDTDELFMHVKNGIKEAIKQFSKIESLAIDTWGVDYILMKGNEDVRPHFAYRNDRVNQRIDQVHAITPFSELYEHTGIQFAAFNTIYQLFDDLKRGRLEGVTDFLMIPEYFSYLLTGVKKKEYTDASTTGLINAKTGQFDLEITRKLGLPDVLFPEVSQPGTFVGMLKEDIAEEVGGQMKVLLCASHDTGSAFEAVDCPSDSIIVSSGTWSLIGNKLEVANTGKKAFEANFTNEGGVGYIRFLKNIMGMWIVNNVQKPKGYSFKEVADLVASSTYEEVFDVNDESLNAPENMELAIKALLKHNPPKNDGDLFNSIFHSLAHSYKVAADEMEKILDKKFNSIYIVGGGANNKYLNGLVEKHSGKKVVALPIEATAIGNIKVQMKEYK